MILLALGLAALALLLRAMVLFVPHAPRTAYAHHFTQPAQPAQPPAPEAPQKPPALEEPKA